jgi:hypothetical protein
LVADVVTETVAALAVVVVAVLEVYFVEQHYSVAAAVLAADLQAVVVAYQEVFQLVATSFEPLELAATVF